MKVFCSQEVASPHRCGAVPGQVAVQASAPPGAVVCPLLVTPGGRLGEYATVQCIDFMHFRLVLFGNKHEISSNSTTEQLAVFIQLIASAEYARTRRVPRQKLRSANLSLDFLIFVIRYRSALSVHVTRLARGASQISLIVVIPAVIGLRWRVACGIDEV